MITENPIVIFTGAGISFDAPTSLPLGLELVDWFIEKVFPSDQEKLISDAKLRPEVIMQILWEFIGASVFQSLASFSERPPNRFHLFLNELEKAKIINSIITTNLDTCHEKAQSSIEKVPIIHLHGKADEPKTILYALDQVSNKKSGELINQFKTLPPECIIIFLGYSGCDDFDIAPVLYNLPGDIKYIWINHVTGMEKWETLTPEKQSPIYSILNSRQTNNAYYICGNTWSFCRSLSSILNLEKEYHEISATYDPLRFNDLKIRNEIQNDIIYNLKDIKKEISELMAAEILFRFIDNSSQAINVCEKIDKSNLDRSEIGAFYRTLGYAQYRRGNYTDSENSFMEAMKYGVRKSFVKRCLVDILYRKNQFTEAKKLIKEVIRDPATNSLDKGNALLSWALILQETGEREKAISIYNEAKEIFKIEGDVYSLSNVYNNKGTIYQDSHLLDKARSEFNKSLKLRELINHNEGICYSLLNIGLVYRSEYCVSQDKKYYKKALNYIYKALSTQANMAASYNRGLILKNLGDIFIDYYELGEATSSLSNAYEIFEVLQCMEGIQFSCALSFLEIYLMQNDTKKVLEMLKKLEELAKYDQLEEKMRWYKALIEGVNTGFEIRKIDPISFHLTYTYRYKQLCTKCNIY